MKKLGEKLKALIDAEAASHGLFVVHYTLGPTGLFRFYMDSEEPLSMGVLTEFTRHISRTIDEGDFGEEAFTFEISSPGATEPLRDRRQYLKHVGRSLKVQVGEVEYKGVFQAFEEGHVIIQNEVKEKGKKKVLIEVVKVPFEDIKEATIILSFK
jgi:ribosome maturation factor RimP